MKTINTHQEYKAVKDRINTLINEATAKGFLDTAEPNEYKTEISRLSAICIAYEKANNMFEELNQEPKPHEIIREEMQEHGLTQVQLAQLLGISTSYLNEVLKGKKGLTATLCVRLESALNLPAEFLLKLQMDYDIKKARENHQHQLKRLTFTKHKTQRPLNDRYKQTI